MTYLHSWRHSLHLTWRTLHISHSWMHWAKITRWSIGIHHWTRPALHRRSLHTRRHSLGRRSICRTLGRSWTRFLLCLKVIESLFGWQCNHWILPMQVLLTQSFHHHAHAAFRTQGNHTKSFRLPIRTIFEKFDLLKVGYTNLSNCIGDILVGCPLL